MSTSKTDENEQNYHGPNNTAFGWRSLTKVKDGKFLIVFDNENNRLFAIWSSIERIKMNVATATKLFEYSFDQERIYINYKDGAFARITLCDDNEAKVKIITDSHDIASPNINGPGKFIYYHENVRIRNKIWIGMTNSNKNCSQKPKEKDVLLMG